MKIPPVKRHVLYSTTFTVEIKLTKPRRDPEETRARCFDLELVWDERIKRKGPNIGERYWKWRWVRSEWMDTWDEHKGMPCVWIENFQS